MVISGRPATSYLKDQYRQADLGEGATYKSQGFDDTKTWIVGVAYGLALTKS